MSRKIPRDRPLSDEDREYLLQRGNIGLIALIDQRYPPGTQESEEEVDDYDEWRVAELQDEIDRLNNEGADITVEGTGKNGAVTKHDLIKALRAYNAS